MDHPVHLADAESVYAEIGTFFGSGDIDDGAILTLEFAGGVIAGGAFIGSITLSGSGN